MERWPNLFLIGAQKGGSTYLASLLAAAPDIAYFVDKEANIFNRDTPGECRAVRDLLAAAGVPQARYLLDASVNYSRYPYFPESAANMQALLGDDAARFLYVLRDPVERMISHYFFNRENWGEGMAFAEAIAADERYIWPGRYDVQIERYLEYFPREAFHFLTFDALIADPAGALARICAWLGIEAPDRIPSGAEARNATDKQVTRHPIFPALNRLVRSNPLLHRLARALPVEAQRAAGRIASRSAPREDIPAQTRRELYQRYFADSVARAETQTGLDLSAWKARYDANGTKD